MREIVERYFFSWGAEAAYVTPADVTRAKEVLRTRCGPDVDRFFEEVESYRLLGEPLGPSQECLSVNEIAQIAELQADAAAGAGARLQERLYHAASCRECQANLRIYKRIEDQISHDLAPAVIVAESPNPIPWGTTQPVAVSVSLNTNCFQHTAYIDPGSVRVYGSITAAGCRLQEADEYGSELRCWTALLEPRWPQARQVRPPPLPICDFLSVEGSTTAGEKFSGRVFVAFCDSDQEPPPPVMRLR